MDHRGDVHVWNDAAPSRIFRRPSIERITFTSPGYDATDQAKRPASALAQPKIWPRPLSNIREISDSHAEEAENSACHVQSNASQDTNHVPAELAQSNGQGRSSSTLTVPLSKLPQRKSSRNLLQRNQSRSLKTSNEGLILNRTYDGEAHQTIPIRAPLTSPVRSAAARLDPISSDMRRTPSRTFIRTTKPTDILDAPKLSHSRALLNTVIAAPLFMGGGTVEGQVIVTIDGGKAINRSTSRPVIAVGRISVDVLGVERCHGKDSIFRSLACELIDEAHPPPSPMMAASRAISDAFWQVAPSTSTLPFRLDLPVYMGPPPYDSKHTQIKYILCVTLAIRISGKQNYVRRSQEIVILSVHDPEKALVNLPNPLTVSDELCVHKTGFNEVIKLTAGVHRQTWVSGIAMFVDVHISNRSSKMVKKIELHLERVTTFYDHTAASTDVEVASRLRLPDRNEKEVVSKSIIKKRRHRWQGVPAQSHYMSTCAVHVPMDLVSIDLGRFFGVRFFVTITISGSFAKDLRVQVPVTLIHPNSLDIVPNSLAQVAAAIEERRTHRSPGRTTRHRYSQGSAYAAPRRYSYEQLDLGFLPSEEVEELTRVLDGSPRKLRKRHSSATAHVLASSHESNKVSMWNPCTSQARKHHSSSKPKGPRLQRSTSALRFDDFSSEDDASKISFNLKSIHSRADSQIQRELSLARKRSKSTSNHGWRNIAAEEAERLKSE